MKNKWIIEIIAALLICLFIYASVSKILMYDNFRAAMLNQPIPSWSARILSWSLPVTEFITAGLLMSTRTRLVGLYAAGFLMLIFTGYIGLILVGSFGRIPCSCGGILKNMGWGVHLMFNILFLLLAIIGIWLDKNEKILDNKENTMYKTVPSGKA
jgi:hypothetical protein